MTNNGFYEKQCLVICVVLFSLIIISSSNGTGQSLKSILHGTTPGVHGKSFVPKHDNNDSVLSHPLNVSNPVAASPNSGNQTRPSRDLDNTLDESTPRPSLWQIFKSNLYPKKEIESEDFLQPSINLSPPPEEKHNYQEVVKDDTSFLPWNAFGNIQSAASKSKLLSLLMSLGNKNEISTTKAPETVLQTSDQRHSPLSLPFNVNVDKNSGQLLHDSIKIFLNVQNSILNHILGRHGQPLLKTSVDEPKKPSAFQLILKPLTDLVISTSSKNNHIIEESKQQKSNDLATEYSEQRQNWSPWNSVPSKSTKWDPWSFDYHVQRPSTEGSILRFWKSLLWNALRKKKQVLIKAKSSLSIIPLIAKIKLGALRRILKVIANKEDSPTFLLLRVIKNALWKGKKAFLRHFLKSRNHLRTKLKYFKQEEKPDTYGEGQDVGHIDLTYDNAVHSPAPDGYNQPVSSLWSSDSYPSAQNKQTFSVLPPVVTSPTPTRYRQHGSSSTGKPDVLVAYENSKDLGVVSETNYGKIVPIPLLLGKTFSFTDKHTRPGRKDDSFSSKLRELKS